MASKQVRRGCSGGWPIPRSVASESAVISSARRSCWVMWDGPAAGRLRLWPSIRPDVEGRTTETSIGGLALWPGPLRAGTGYLHDNTVRCQRVADLHGHWSAHTEDGITTFTTRGGRSLVRSARGDVDRRVDTTLMS